MNLSPKSFSSFGLSNDDDDGVALRPPPVAGGAMLPIFLSSLSRNGSGSSWERELVEVTLELDGDDSIVVCGMSEAASVDTRPRSAGRLTRSLSTAPARIRQTLEKLLRSESTRTTASSVSTETGRFTRIRQTLGKLLRSDSTRTTTSVCRERDIERQTPIMSARDKRKEEVKLQRTRSSAQRALQGLQFINKTTKGNSCGCDWECGCDEMWKKVEKRFETLSKEGLLAREDFGECVGMKDSKEFAVSVFDALARRRRQKLEKITKDELHDFWLLISDQSFDARLQIFFDILPSIRKQMY
ncbi:respiratory burst oxidase homolog protein E isoform X2 [Raphanus sativus]|uniref:Respiratory burst oxidase homolog protein E isoform X2 n=1 Tax=Raphanus sativus TaxID=3726 RepID=A0A6J0M444_RAPSA|nr:respiratory burst oxidase homolog protein E isoform X2 [Raphanus sativus]